MTNATTMNASRMATTMEVTGLTQGTIVMPVSVLRRDALRRERPMTTDR